MVAINSLQSIVALVLVLAVNSEIKFKNEEVRSIRCYPSRFEIDQMYNSLSKVINYFWINRKHIDLTVYIALFLTRVHLRTAWFNFNSDLYNHTELDIYQLVTNCTNSIDYFGAKLLSEKLDQKKMLMYDILDLFIADGTWYYEDRIIKVEPYINFEEELITSDFDNYVKEVYNYTEIEPSYHYLSKCMGLLSHTSYQYPHGSKGCPLTWICHMIYKPNPIGVQAVGFSLTNKAAFLLLTKYSRSCHVTVFREEMIKHYCQKMYVEGISNYKQKLPLINLLAEQMAVCSLARRGEMLYKEWFDILKRYQEETGCLVGKGPYAKEHEEKEFKGGYRAFNAYGLLPNNNKTYCNRHLTTMYMVALAGGLRLAIWLPDKLQGDLCKHYYDKIHIYN